MKECSKCGETLPFTQFYKDCQKGDGLYSSCKECQKASNKSNYLKMSLETKMWHRAKYRASQKGIEFSISVEDIVIPKHCPVLGIQLFPNEAGKGACDNSPSLDRINNDVGYVKSNIHVISDRANSLKKDATIDELRLILQYMEGHS